MSEESPDISTETTGPVSEENSTESAEQSFAEIVTANEKTEKDAELAFLRSKGLVDTPDENQPDNESQEDKELPVSDETSEEEETTTEDTTDDDSVEEETNDEVEDAPEGDEITLLDYEETKGFKFPVKIKGKVKHMTLDEMQNQIARVESANEKSLSAKMQLEELNEFKSKLDQREELVSRQEALTNEDLKLAQMNHYAKQLEENMDNAPNFEQHKKLSAELRKVKNDARKLEDEIIKTKEDVRINKMKEQHDILKKAEFKVTEEFANYVSSKLSGLAFDAVNENADLLMLLDKAFKYDNLKTKTKNAESRLTKKKTLPKGKGSNPIPKATKADQARNTRMSKGIGTDADADAVLNRIMAAKNL